jgi:hypothetical protein
MKSSIKKRLSTRAGAFGLASALLLGSASAFGAGPGNGPAPSKPASKERAVENPTRHRGMPPGFRFTHRRSLPERVAGPRFAANARSLRLEGTLARIRDGRVIVSNPLPEPMRQEMARMRKVPVASIPAQIERAARVGSPAQLKELKDRVGQTVSLEVAQDRSGTYFVRTVGAGRR